MTLATVNKASAYYRARLGPGLEIATNLNEILASRAKTKFAHRINFEEISFDNSKEMKVWCDENCTGIWKIHTAHALYFQFENDQDAMMFMLRWGGIQGNTIL